ncbi:hypothetical protein AB0F91_16675 [Amycolatopsis sp. NPDC023774]|uniref:hypothetical protein n=1 Tax=Amycolatopsis sp. NPDC023774 TaxID=3155015 RepID=UPI0033E507FC
MSWYKALALVTSGAAALGMAQPSTIGADGVGDPCFPQDGNGGYDVSRYDAQVSYDPANPGSFTGDTTGHAAARQDLDRFDLDVEGSRSPR